MVDIGFLPEESRLGLGRSTAGDELSTGQLEFVMDPVQGNVGRAGWIRSRQGGGLAVDPVLEGPPREGIDRDRRLGDLLESGGEALMGRGIDADRLDALDRI